MAPPRDRDIPLACGPPDGNPASASDVEKTTATSCTGDVPAVRLRPTSHPRPLPRVRKGSKQQLKIACVMLNACYHWAMAVAFHKVIFVLSCGAMVSLAVIWPASYRYGLSIYHVGVDRGACGIVFEGGNVSLRYGDNPDAVPVAVASRIFASDGMAYWGTQDWGSKWLGVWTMDAGSHSRIVCLEDWLLVAMTSLVAWLCWRRIRQPFPPGTCQKCGYDLRATPDRCPECGHHTK